VARADSGLLGQQRSTFASPGRTTKGPRSMRGPSSFVWPFVRLRGVPQAIS